MCKPQNGCAHSCTKRPLKPLKTVLPLATMYQERKTVKFIAHSCKTLETVRMKVLPLVGKVGQACLGQRQPPACRCGTEPASPLCPGASSTPFSVWVQYGILHTFCVVKHLREDFAGVTSWGFSLLFTTTSFLTFLRKSPPLASVAAHLLSLASCVHLPPAGCPLYNPASTRS